MSGPGLIARGRADPRDDGAADACVGRRAGHDLLGRGRVAVERNGPDVPVDERLPSGALAEADPRPTRLAGGGLDRLDANARLIRRVHGLALVDREANAPGIEPHA